MNSIPPFNLPGRFWRGNLHTHTTRSDGTRSPEFVCRYYRALGYDFLSITDHMLPQYGNPITDTTPYRTADFTTLIGAELHAGQIGSNGEIWHILANGLPLDFAPSAPDETGPELAARALAAGAFVTCAHPAWYALTEDEVISLGDVHAIETINGISADHSDRIDSWYMLDALLARGRRYYALTTDDAHFHAINADVMLAWTWVKAETLTPEALLAALKAGHYYSSSGPQILDLQFDRAAGRAYIQCSPVESIFIIGRGSHSVYHHGNGLIEAELSLKRLGDSPYCRVMVRDARGGRAWTNPIFFEDGVGSG